MNVKVQKAREAIVCTGKRMQNAGLVAGSYGNISQRLPDDGVVVITPSGVDYQNLCARDMVVVTMDGAVAEGERKPSTELMLHLAIYHTRPDANAIVHTHSLYASALAAARRPLPVILEEVAHVIGGPVEVATYGPSGSEALARAAAAKIGKVKATLLANHGVVGLGATLEEALMVCQTVERAALVYCMARLVGEPVALSPQETEALHHQYVTTYGQRG